MDKYIDYYNDSKKVTYHEQTDISNILKLRAVLKTLPDFSARIIFVLWIRLLLPKHEFPMRMISESFFSFFWMKILPLRTIP